MLIAGAAGNFPAPVLGMSANGFKAVIDIDLLGTFNVCRAAHQYLTKPGASVIAISAGQADTPMAYQAHVCAAKAGVNLLIQSLALEWGPDGIRLNCIAPGPTEDTEGMRRLAPTDEHRAKVLTRVPLGRYGTKDELADLALFFFVSGPNPWTAAAWHKPDKAFLPYGEMLSPRGKQANVGARTYLQWEYAWEKRAKVARRCGPNLPGCTSLL